jgi:kinetochore protein Spc7/SPC105
VSLNLFLCFKDARTLEELIRSADGLIPELEQEYQSLTEELEREQVEVAEIESGDQDYLNELKATVAEQKYVDFGHKKKIPYSKLYLFSIEIEALKAELSEGKDQLRWLQERAEELEAQKREAKNAIAIAEQILHRKKNSTRSEIFRLKGEYF